MRKRLIRRDERGAALVEFALVVPLFVFVLYALIAFGLALSTKHKVTNAAAEGARAGVGAADYATATSRATSRITTVLGAPAGRYAVTIPAEAAAPSCGAEKCLSVTIVWDYQNYPVVPEALGLGVALPDTVSSTAIVDYS